MKNFLLFFVMSLFSICLQAQTTISTSATITQSDINGFSWPVIINSGSSSSPVVVTLAEDLTISDPNQYFVIESEYVEFNGNNYIITLDNTNGYPGLLQNGTSSLIGYDNVTINNVHVVSNGSSLIDYGGWIGQSYFGASVANVSINNCSSSGYISYAGGGITGEHSNVAADHCHSTGNMSDAAGGIYGESSNGIATNCYSLGNIGNAGGGIFGNISDGSASNCYSTGAIGGQGGGILGNGATGTTTNCYSTGDIIADYGGGIIGAGGNGTAVNCYSSGSIGTNAGGILGGFSSGTANNCYSLGTLGSGAGGINGSPFFGSFTNCYFTDGNDWSDADANDNLIDVSTVWTVFGSDMPYKLSSFNEIIYSPATESKSENALITSPTGNFSTGTYSIVSINDADPSDQPSVTIDATSGMLSFTNSGAGSFTSKIIYTDNSDGSYQVSDYTLNILSTLPVTWRSFTVAPRGNTAWLQWSTSSEQNTSDFNVQHSINGSNWTTISTTPAAGNSNSISNYNYLHADPVNGNNYYRIQQTDIDGKYSYSSVQNMKVTLSSKSFSVINTVVSNGVLQVEVKASSTLYLYNNDGKLIWQKRYNTGSQNIDLGNMPKGVYFLKGKDAAEKIIVR
jgi:hypothetical protein